MVRPLQILLLGVAASALPGCTLEPVRDSSEVSTRDLLVVVEASDEGAGASASIQLIGPGPVGTVRLAGGDALRLSIAGVTWPLREVDDARGVVYLAEPDALAGDLVLDLERPNDRSVLDLVSPAPPPFTLSAEDLSVEQPLALTWDAAPGEHVLDLLIEGDCIGVLARRLATDTGAYAVVQAELPAPSPAPCPLRVTLTRTSTNQAPLLPGVDGGHLYAHAVQRRTVEVQWLP